RKPEYEITFSDSEIIDESGNRAGKVFSQLHPPPRVVGGNIFRQLCETNFINLQTVLMRRRCLGDDIVFDEKMRSLEDWWLWLQLARKHNFFLDTRVLAQYRVHTWNTNVRQKRDFALNRYKVAKRNVKTNRDLPADLKALSWYQMSASLDLLGKPYFATKFLWHTLGIMLRSRTGPKQYAGWLKRISKL